MIIFNIVMKRRDEWKAIEIRVELKPDFQEDDKGLFDRLFVYIRNMTTRTISVQTMAFRFGKTGEERGHWDRGPEGNLLSPDDVERDKSTHRGISVGEFVKAFGKRIGDDYKLPLPEFRKRVKGFIQTAGTPTFHAYEIPERFLFKVKEQMEADAYFKHKP